MRKEGKKGEKRRERQSRKTLTGGEREEFPTSQEHSAPAVKMMHHFISFYLVKINLYTGRHHQIRVQLSNFGHSIFGDQKYGNRGKGKQIALWAYYLSFEHPITKERLEFKLLPENKGTWHWDINGDV